jgi:hypothetical protein
MGPQYGKRLYIFRLCYPSNIVSQVFYVTPGINADHMQYTEEGRLCRVQGTAPKVPNDASPIGDNKNPYQYSAGYPIFPSLYMGKDKPAAPGLRAKPGSPKAPKAGDEMAATPGTAAGAISAPNGPKVPTAETAGTAPGAQGALVPGSASTGKGN